VDVVIVGGGSTGGALAASLSKSNFFNPDKHQKIVLIE